MRGGPTGRRQGYIRGGGGGGWSWSAGSQGLLASRIPSTIFLSRMPKGPRRTKNTTRSKFTTRSVFTIALQFTIAAHLVRTPFSWELQTFSSPRRVRVVVNLGA